MAGSAFKVEPPALPQGTPTYFQTYQDQLNNVQRLFYNRLTSSLNALIDPGTGGAALNFPYGSFYDTTDQYAASTTAAYELNLNTTSFSNGVSVQNNSELTVEKPGVYNVQFSIQFVNDTNAQKDVDIWFRKNGVDIPDSNSKFTVHARKSAGIFGYLIAALNLFVDLQANEYVEIMWWTEDVNVHIEYGSAATLPTRPAIPSAIVTVSFVSAL